MMAVGGVSGLWQRLPTELLRLGPCLLGLGVLLLLLLGGMLPLLLPLLLLSLVVLVVTLPLRLRLASPLLHALVLYPS